MQKKWIPGGYQIVTPYLTIRDAAGFIKFVEKTFGGVSTECLKTDDGKVAHAEIRIGDSVIMVGEACGEWKTKPGNLYIYVEDCDVYYHRALKNGAVSLRKPADQFYGDRSGGVEDQWGNSWWMATHIETLSHQELQKRIDKMKKEPALKK